MSRWTYEPVEASEVPPTVRWDVPQHLRGQMVEEAYSESHAGAGEGGEGDKWQRITDASDRSVRYFRRVGPRWP